MLLQDDMGVPLVHSGRLIGYYIGGDLCHSVDVYANIASSHQWMIDKIKENSNENEQERDEDDDFYKDVVECSYTN